jgi:peroxiredoxin
MSLQEQLDQQRKTAFAARTPEERSVRADAIADVDRSGLARAALGVGEVVPEFVLPDPHGRQVGIADLLVGGPAVISFYRGGWCPYCNLELRALQARLPELRELGASLVAISPELPDRSLSTEEKNGLSFPVLSDHSNEVARKFRIVHAIPPDVVAYQHRNGNDVASYNGAKTAEVPLPATYVVDGGGVVHYAFVAADYTRRADPDEVVVAARAIAGHRRTAGFAKRDEQRR